MRKGAPTPLTRALSSEGRGRQKEGTTNMPKMKTKRAAAKRFKATASGKLKRRSGWKRHKLEGKSPKRRRKLRKATMITAADQPRLKRLVPYL
jgi:large subunit ribosomal protein L35